MIKHYTNDSDSACWGVSRITHLPILGDDGLARTENKVLLQVEDGDAYSRRPLSVAQALEVASFLAGAIIHVQAYGTAHYDRAAVHYNVRTDSEGGILLSLSDTVVTEGQFTRIRISCGDAREMINLLTTIASDQLERVMHGGFPSEKEASLDDLRKIEATLIKNLSGVETRFDAHRPTWQRQLAHVRAQITERESAQ